MEKKYVIGGSIVAFLAGLGLFGVANEARKEVAQEQTTIEAPAQVDPAAPVVTPEQVPTEAPAETPAENQSWGEWFSDWVPGIGDTKDGDTPNDIINKQLGR